MNALDLAILAVIVLSGLFAFARGFVKEALSIGAWVGAGLAALYAIPAAAPIAARFVPKGPAAETLGGLVVFLVVLIVLSLVTTAIARRVKSSSLSAIDRTMGLIFGLVRGALVVCLVWLALAWALPPGADRPRWIADARTLPLLESGGEALKRLLPANYRDRVATAAARAGDTANQEAADAIRALAKPRPAPAATAMPVYTPEDKRDLQRLFEQNAR